MVLTNESNNGARLVVTYPASLIKIPSASAYVTALSAFEPESPPVT